MIYNLENFRTLFSSSLSQLYDTQEIRAILYAYFSRKFAIPSYEFSLNPQKSLTKEDGEAVESDLRRLERGEPLQYVLGYAEFYGLPMNVSPKVLIPRPETEELVEKILDFCQDSSKKYQILDFCTGSGAIAIALALFLPFASVTATDYEEEILRLAAQNATQNAVNVQWLRHDVLKDSSEILGGPYDVVVSNPPYIPLSVRATLHRNVADYEPAAALFVPDDDPLLFYRHIARLSSEILRPGGRLFFETFENFHEELESMLSSFPFKDIQKVNDINQKPRFIICTKTT